MRDAASEFYGGKKYSVQWWVGALLRLRRTAREANYFSVRWEYNLELEFSNYFGLEGTSARAKNLVRALQIVELIEATPEEREKRCRESKGAARRLKEVHAWNSKFSGKLPDGNETWDYFYISALERLRNARRIAQDHGEPEESSVRELAMRIRVWSDLFANKKYHTNAFNKLLFNPGSPADCMEMEIQKEIRKLRDNPKRQPVWSRLTRRYRAKIQ